MAISMSQDQYELLLDYAYGRKTADDNLSSLQRSIDAANGVKRFFLYIRWMETGGQPPSPIQIGLGWPPTQEFKLRMNRAISRSDVDDILRTQAVRPVYVTVTNDERGAVGWTELDVWDFYLNQ